MTTTSSSSLNVGPRSKDAKVAFFSIKSHSSSWSSFESSIPSLSSSSNVPEASLVTPCIPRAVSISEALFASSSFRSSVKAVTSTSVAFPPTSPVSSLTSLSTFTNTVHSSLTPVDSPLTSLGSLSPAWCSLMSLWSSRIEGSCSSSLPLTSPTTERPWESSNTCLMGESPA
ncbi:hypothetical protein E2C01_025726 [Portunus trituberculatus]|uniref:Uncharacterized protein n=1 Tax=Portunus trituberculatus TaxID=210409 RepID=A0A5B7EGH9_PORTR|nr:hypothetical protein [Portunus trituberculatus]